METIDWEFEQFLYDERQKDLKKAFAVLNKMMETFKDWFPFDADYDENDRKNAEESFARTKLCLELGEYDNDDYEYLFWIREKCAGYQEYDWAIGVFITALSDEYGWI